MKFSQSEFFGGFPALSYMDTIGYVYVPTACQNGACKILYLLKLLLTVLIFFQHVDFTLYFMVV